MENMAAEQQLLYLAFFFFCARVAAVAGAGRDAPGPECVNLVIHLFDVISLALQASLRAFGID